MHPSCPGREAAFPVPWGAIVLWVLAAALFLAMRPILPTDEARALAVAWEMHLDGQWLLPHLNGAPYPEKPPLLAWLVNGAWALSGGVTETAARLVTPVLGVLALLLTSALSSRLFPGRGSRVHRAAPLVLVSLPLWLWWGSLGLYDLPLATAVLGAHAAMLAFALGGRAGWTLAAGLALGAGVLLKGPVVFVHTLPAWLAWAWWRPEPGIRPMRWWAGVATAVALGAGIGLGWAWAAGALGGEAYASRLWFTATGARLGANAAHAQPWWWYAPIVPVILLPWLARPGTWVAVKRCVRSPAGSGYVSGGRYLTAWIGASLLILTMAKGKQPHYLVPVLPALALAIAAGLPDAGPGQRSNAWPVALVFVGIAALMLALPAACEPCVPATVSYPPSPWWTAVPLAAAAAFAVAGACRVRAWPGIPAAMVAVLLAMTAWAEPVLDLEQTDRLATVVGELQAGGHEVAQLRRYHGEYQFTGRLRQPIRWFPDAGDLAGWAERHPDGYVIVQGTPEPGALQGGVVFKTAYRGGTSALWPVRMAVHAGLIPPPAGSSAAPNVRATN